MTSREIVETISARMFGLANGPMRVLADHLMSRPGTPPGVKQYFLPIGQLDRVLQLVNKGTVPDFDSFVGTSQGPSCFYTASMTCCTGQVGIDCMLQRVIDLCNDIQVCLLPPRGETVS